MLRTRQHPHRARHPQPGVGGGQLGAALLALLLGGCDVAADDDDSAGDLQRAESDVAAAFDPALADGFWSFPFPSDARTIDGHPDLTGYPNPGDSNLLAEYIAFATDHLDGFGLNSPIWMRFDGEVSIPAMDEDSIRASRDCQGPLRLVDVTPQSPTYGRCTPLRWAWIDGLNQDPFVDSYTAVLAPYWGFPLRSGTTYAAYVVDAQDGIGAYLTASATLAELLEGRSPDTSLQAVYRPLADLFAADPSHLGARPEDGVRWIAAATVFTTQDAVGELEVLADSVLSDPDYPVWTEELTLLGSDHEHYQPEFDIWDGSYVAQNFQRGTIPYASEGGGFVFEDGVPVPQMQERIPFAIGMPRHGRVQPAEGWPVIVQMPGTGGDRFSHLDGSTLRPGLLAASRDFLSLSIPPPIHGDRWPAGNDLSRSLNSFNYFNPESGISMFRQGAIDIVAAVRFLQENLAAGGPIAEAHPELRINPDAIFYLGHSQGGIHGALAVPFAEGVHAWALSGAGGGPEHDDDAAGGPPGHPRRAADRSRRSARHGALRPAPRHRTGADQRRAHRPDQLRAPLGPGVERRAGLDRPDLGPAGPADAGRHERGPRRRRRPADRRALLRARRVRPRAPRPPAPADALRRQRDAPRRRPRDPRGRPVRRQPLRHLPRPRRGDALGEPAVLLRPGRRAGGDGRQLPLRAAVDRRPGRG